MMRGLGWVCLVQQVLALVRDCVLQLVFLLLPRAFQLVLVWLQEVALLVLAFQLVRSSPRLQSSLLLVSLPGWVSLLV